jgi:hypothetical protein
VKGIMQELTDSIKRTNFRIMGTEEVQAKGIPNIFNKIITENFPNLEKTIPIQVQEASRSLYRLNSPSKRHHLAKWIKKEDPKICCLQETHLIVEAITGLG